MFAKISDPDIFRRILVAKPALEIGWLKRWICLNTLQRCRGGFIVFERIMVCTWSDFVITLHAKRLQECVFAIGSLLTWEMPDSRTVSVCCEFESCEWNNFYGFKPEPAWLTRLTLNQRPQVRLEVNWGKILSHHVKGFSWHLLNGECFGTILEANSSLLRFWTVS